jgi:Winged helix DNA-binding domain
MRTHAARLTAQLLAGPPARDPVAVAERLLAIQGQDPRGFRLAVRARTQGLTAADVDRALTEERSLLVTWLNRGTLHLVRSEDYALLHAVTTPPLRTGSARRLAQEGVPGPKRGVALIERALADEGPLTADSLRERLETTGVHAKGQALYHLLFRASLDGLIVRGPMAGAKQAYVLVRDWLGEQRPINRERALGEFARRYLAGHGPATDRDLARWAGIPLRDARAGFSAIAGDLERSDPAGLLALRGSPEPVEFSPPKLLGAFEPVLLGWVSRTQMFGEIAERVTDGGMFHPFALVNGRPAARWRLERGEGVIEPFGRLRQADVAHLERDLVAAQRFLAA